MAVLKCKMCGGSLTVEEGATVCECEYCGTKQTIPNIDNEKKLNLFSRANRLRMGNEFDKAYSVYESIVSEFPEEAEAYWGLILCRYGIEYVDDPYDGRKVPTCHRSSFDSVMEDPNFEMVMEYSDSVARKVYREEAKAIEELRKKIVEVSSKEEPYQIFISYKETDEDGNRTLDSVLAQDIYDALVKEGYRVFFSRISLEDKLGTEYEPYIFAALHSAKVMLVVGTDYEYFNAVWVKNEWSRYLQLIAHGENKTLIPCYKGIDAYDMPKEFARLQAQDLGKVGAIQDLIRGINKILGGKTEKTKPVIATVSEPNTDSLLTRGNMALEDGDFETAESYFNKVLDIDPYNGKAYLGNLLVELKYGTISDIFEHREELFKGSSNKVENSRNYQRFVQYADKEKVKEVNDVIEEAKTVLAREIKEAEEERLRAEKEKAERLQREKEEKEERLQREKEEKEENERKRREALIAEREELIKRIKSKNFELNAAEQGQLADLKKEEQTLTEQKASTLQKYESSQEYKLIKDLEKQITNKTDYLGTLGLFKGKEKEQVRYEISVLERQLQTVQSKVENLLQSVELITGRMSEINRQISTYKELCFSRSVERIVQISAEFKLELMGLRFSDEGCIEFGRYLQRKNDLTEYPVEWKILAQNGYRVLVISKYGIDCQPYNKKSKDVTWEKCTLRKWLNNDFLNKAFNPNEQRMIPIVKVIAEKNPGYDTDPGKDTNDKVFLLSINEANKYFKNDEERWCYRTYYASDKGAGGEKNKWGFVGCYWWLRSPGNSSYVAAVVRNDGHVDTAGSYGNCGSVVHSDNAVRPALWIDLESLFF